MKKMIIIISVTIIIILVMIGIILYVNNPQVSSNNIDVFNSKITNDGTYVEKGLEKLSQLAKPAIENYVNQSTSELTDSRNTRLGKYFSSDSPVYSYTPDMVGNTISKTTAKVTSITSWPMEGDGKMLIAMTNTTFFYMGGSTSVDQTYWITMYKEADGSFKSYDIGIKQ